MLATLPGLEPCGVPAFDDAFDLVELGLEGVAPAPEMMELPELDCDPCVKLSGLI